MLERRLQRVMAMLVPSSLWLDPPLPWPDLCLQCLGPLALLVLNHLQDPLGRRRVPTCHQLRRGGTGSKLTSLRGSNHQSLKRKKTRAYRKRIYKPRLDMVVGSADSPVRYLSSIDLVRPVFVF